MTTVGVLTPHATPGPELEIPTMSSGRVATLVSRIPVRGVTPEQLRHGTRPSVMDAAATAFAPGSVDALAYASTSSGYAIGVAAERELVAALRDRRHLAVVSSGLAAVDALQTFGVGFVTLVHPPWFDDEAGGLGPSYFRTQDVDAVAMRASSLPNEPDRVRPQQVADWVAGRLDDRTEAVFLGGNGFHTVGAVDEIERRTGALVLTANQVLLWALLGETHTPLAIAGYGRLFSVRAPSTVRDPT